MGATALPHMLYSLISTLNSSLSTHNRREIFELSCDGITTLLDQSCSADDIVYTAQRQLFPFRTAFQAIKNSTGIYSSK